MKRHIVFGSVVVAIILMWGASWYFIPKLYDAQSLEAGTFGDMFGAVNALFSGLAFAGLIYTITVQRQELSLQREAIRMQTEELKLQRLETARSADQFESQSKLLNLQIVMTIVNDLIKSKNKRLGNIKLRINGIDEIGVRAITVLVKRNMSLNRPILEDDPVLHSYCRSFIYILQFINDSDLELDQKKVVSKLVDMDTGDSEIYILFTAFANDQHLFDLLNKYDFLDRYNNIKMNLLANTYEPSN
ncbi:hypothetical protein QUF95_07190 [Paenibacillus silvae]|uniref:hypothetical protein n=1 Tax=Paenibacillus silvae TaxID=1325358 RepID=UPI0025A11B8F|nr:hypothetical protein [Paenibacillus silvae]MDM5277160.1 hypothetical protein [Paenibacillus silvae]